jgi:hypothetical protein
MGKPTGSVTPLPIPRNRVDSLTLDVEILGLKMTRVDAGAFKAGRAGDWLVVQAFLPRSAESFLLGLNDRMNAGEIVVAKPDSVPAVVDTLSQVFG